MLKVRRISLFLGFSILVLAIIACTINVGGPSFPNQKIPVSTQAEGDLLLAIQTAVAGGIDSGQITLTIDESQITSYLADRLSEQSQPVLTEPQVYLRNDQIQVFGVATQGYFQANIEIVITASVDSQGQLKIDLASADFGPFPVPAGLKDAITAAIQEAFTGAIGPAAVGFRLESLTIVDGTMTVTGRIK